MLVSILFGACRVFFVCHRDLTSIIVLPAAWAQACGLEHETPLSSSCILGSCVSAAVFLFVFVCWWEQYHDTATSGTGYSDLRNRDNFGLLVCWWTVHSISVLFFLYKVLRREIHSWLRSPVWDETMARQWERVDEDKAVGPRFGQDPPPSFSAPTPAYTYRQWKCDLRLWLATSSLQKNRQGRWLLRPLKGGCRTAAEVVMDDALIQDGGIDSIVGDLDRCWEVTQDQDKPSKIEKDLLETQRRDVKTETTVMSYVARRKLNFQQLESALGTLLPAVVTGHATLRGAKRAGSSYDKVVMCTGGSFD